MIYLFLVKLYVLRLAKKNRKGSQNSSMFSAQWQWRILFSARLLHPPPHTLSIPIQMALNLKCANICTQIPACIYTWHTQTFTSPPPHTHMHTHTHTHTHMQAQTHTHTRCPLYLRVIRMLQAALQALGEVGHHVQGCAILKHHPDASVRVGSESAVARHSALFQHWGGQWLHHLHRRMLHSTEHWPQSPYWPGSFPFANIHTQARLTLKVAQYCGTPS